MTNATVSRLGQVNGANDEKALFLKVFGGEVMTTFRNMRIMGPETHRVRNITSGKEAQFPAIGKATAAYHTPGVQLTGRVINHAERVIGIDRMLIADTFVAKIDELMNHYEVRADYASELAETIAQTYDLDALTVIANAARASATVSGNSGGSTITGTSTNFETDGSALIAGLYDAAVALDEKAIPESGRLCAVKPAQYWNMIEDTDSEIMNRDYGGRGSLATGDLPMAAGFMILKTNNLPNSNRTSQESSQYEGDFRKVEALCWTPPAVGTVELLGITPDSWEEKNRRGHMLIAEMAVGHGILRPECAVELVNA